jgi:hypothetical protein
MRRTNTFNGRPNKITVKKLIDYVIVDPECHLAAEVGIAPFPTFEKALITWKG